MRQPRNANAARRGHTASANMRHCALHAETLVFIFVFLLFFIASVPPLSFSFRIHFARQSVVVLWVDSATFKRTREGREVGKRDVDVMWGLK